MEHLQRALADAPRVVGVISWETRDALTGALIAEESGTTKNIVTDVGLTQLAKIITQQAYTTNFEIAVGTGSTAPAAGDTALVAQVLKAAVTSQNSSSAVATYKLFLDTTQANGNTLAEAGLFHNLVLVDRALLSPTVAKTSGKTVTVTVQLTLSR